jgi:hypothetical protein
MQAKKRMIVIGWTLITVFICVSAVFGASPVTVATTPDFPRGLDSYGDSEEINIFTILVNRIKQEPFNLVATLIFLAAIIHTFMTGKFMAVAHRWEHEHEKKIEQGKASRHTVHHGAELFHFFGEVEVVFGLWAIALVVAIFSFYDWNAVVHYLSNRVNYTEPMFVVVIMILAATRPIIKLSETIMNKIAGLLGATLTAWWLTILTIGPLLGSFITEPAAMTISALLLGNKFYALEPSKKFKYATIGLLFVNISIGGTLTHFAAPPVLMVAGPWDWGTGYMIMRFGWKAVIGILLSNGIYFLMFRKELNDLQAKFEYRRIQDDIRRVAMKREGIIAEWNVFAAEVERELGAIDIYMENTRKLTSEIKKRVASKIIPEVIAKGHNPDLVKEAFERRFEEIKMRKMREFLPGLLPPEMRPRFIDPEWDNRDDPVPYWITGFHVFFMVWTIVNAHHPQMFLAGLMFFLGFSVVTSPFQNRLDLKPPLLVGFFLAGLVIHGGVQGWWIAPVLGGLEEIPLMLGATILTAFNDNAAITYLSTLVPGMTEAMKYSVVAGAVTGGGLTVIANAPNPAGQSILKKYFADEVSPLGILKGALIPTTIAWVIFLALLRVGG